MKLTRLEIPGLFLVEPKVFNDGRGFFYEYYREDIFRANGIDVSFVQDNHSRSQRGVLRGLHFQIEPYAQAKLVRVTRGSVYDVAVDLRPGSSSFGRYLALELSASNRRMLYVPAGFAHGFCVLEDDTEFSYKVSNFYSPPHERGIRWDDPALGIPWPKPGMDFILSDKDKKYPTLKEYLNAQR
ncbi:MAG TPA: dTDP-4-dehydrorhamnose 3,5-epimerase [Verrucomicrobiae bacterium]|jgi:dTDP-4-dehydrorhamnose 3,5-epimerase|nr:dTDP-4-dehydrorhamnose 3,5-epimerase [Verrucomicrobiae bacterium]